MEDTQTIAIFLEEVSYFLDDMQKDLWWLVQAAHQAAIGPLLTGDEVLEDVTPPVRAVIDALKERADMHKDAHEGQVRAKITIIPNVDATERAVLMELKKLQFHCKGRVEIFPCMKEANNSAIWAAYHLHVSTAEPQWLVKIDGPSQKQVFAQCAVIIPVLVDKRKEEIKLFNIWEPEKKKRHWAFPGGDIRRGSDRSLSDTVKRVFRDEVGICFGREWNECFEAELPEDISQETPGVLLYSHLEKDGSRYPSRPHIFVQVTEDFYEATRAYEDSNGVITLPQPEGDFVKWDDLSSAQKVHREGIRFLEHEEARWLTVEFRTGKFYADDQKQLRKENADLIRQKPEKIWTYFANLLGVEPLERSSLLPADFPLEGPFAVRMSGIDKTASDDDIKSFFTDESVQVVKAEQFEVPKHTARIEFADVLTLEQALLLTGRSLLRRKVKVELWMDLDENTSRAAPGAKPLKAYDGPLPEAPPWQVRVKGLDKLVSRDDIGYFFWDRDCQVKDVQFPIKTERHAAIVEFNELSSIQAAMGLNGAVFKGREVTIEITSAREEAMRASAQGGAAGGGGGNRAKGGGGGGYSGGGGGKGKGKGGGFDREDREPPSRSEFGSERPRLQLKPKSEDTGGGRFDALGDDGGARSNPFGAAGPAGKPAGSGGAAPKQNDPFGGARARDERFKPTKADADDNWRR